MRRTLIIAALVVVALGVLAGVYYFFLSAPSVSVAPQGSATLPGAGPSAAGNGTTGTTATGGSAASTPTSVSARLVEISKGPVVPGEAAIDVGDASTTDTAIEYLERESGNVYTYSENSGTITRTSNRTVPGIESAVWRPDGVSAFVRYLSGDAFSTVNTYALAADGSGGFFMPQDLADIAVSSSSVLVLASGVNGSSASLYRPDGTSATEAFTTPLSSLRIGFAGSGHYLAFTKPSAALPGYAYLVDAKGGFSRIAGPLTGLVALASPDGKKALVSYSSGGIMKMELVDSATGSATALPVATIADKCVWATDSTAAYCGIPTAPPSSYAYPDDWYQGAVSFSDRIWKIDVSGRYAQLVLDFTKETGGALDATALAVDPHATALVFVNKNDASLWSYKL